MGGRGKITTLFVPAPGFRTVQNGDFLSTTTTTTKKTTSETTTTKTTTTKKTTTKVKKKLKCLYVIGAIICTVQEIVWSPVYWIFYFKVRIGCELVVFKFLSANISWDLGFIFFLF